MCNRCNPPLAIITSRVDVHPAQGRASGYLVGLALLAVSLELGQVSIEGFLELLERLDLKPDVGHCLLDLGRDLRETGDK